MRANSNFRQTFESGGAGARLARFLQKLVPAAKPGQARQVWHWLPLVELPAIQDEPGQRLEPAQDVDPVAAADRRLEQAGIGPA